MLDTVFIVGFTGHRKGFDEAVARGAMTSALLRLKNDRLPEGARLEVYCSLAEGADVVFAEVATELEIPTHVILPLPAEDFERDFSTPESWQRSLALIQAARDSRTGSLRVLSSSRDRPDCYYDQGIQMLEACDVLIALWDGEPARGLGGTAQIIGQAEREKIPMIKIAASNGAISEPPELSETFKPDAAIDEINKIAKATNVPCAEDASTADHLQTCLDAIAIEEAAKFRPSLVRIIVLHTTAALLAAIVTFKFASGSTWEDWKWTITALEFVLVTYAFIITYLLHRRHTHRRWIRCRFACELLRGLRRSVPILDPLHPSVRYHDPAWARFAVSSGLLVSRDSKGTDPRALRDEYVAVRLSETHEEGQIRHFMKMSPVAESRWKTTGVIAKWSALLAPIFVLFSLINKLSHLEHAPAFLAPLDALHLGDRFPSWVVVALLPIALPLLAGAASAIRQALDAGRRRQRYPEMVALLTAFKARLTGLETHGSIHHTVGQVEDILLDELREWQLTATNNEAH